MNQSRLINDIITEYSLKARQFCVLASTALSLSLCTRNQAPEQEEAEEWAAKDTVRNARRRLGWITTSSSTSPSAKYVKPPMVLRQTPLPPSHLLFLCLLLLLFLRRNVSFTTPLPLPLPPSLFLCLCLFLLVLRQTPPPLPPSLLLFLCLLLVLRRNLSFTTPLPLPPPPPPPLTPPLPLSTGLLLKMILFFTTFLKCVDGNARLIYLIT